MRRDSDLRFAASFGSIGELRDRFEAKKGPDSFSDQSRPRHLLVDKEAEDRMVRHRILVSEEQKQSLLFLVHLAGSLLGTVATFPLPLFFSLTGTGIFTLLVVFFFPRTASQVLLYPGFRLLFGTLYPAYASYKAVRTKNVKEYVKWMMYWIVFAFFTCIETFTDLFLAWFPFYYEIKVILVVWLLSPATKGSSTLYRKFVHPMLTRREQEIDEYISQAKEKGYTAVLQLGSKGVNYATNVIMQTAIKAIHMSQAAELGLPSPSAPPHQRPFDVVDDGRQQRSFSLPPPAAELDDEDVVMEAFEASLQRNAIYEIDSDEEEAFLNGAEHNGGGSARARAVPKRTRARAKARPPIGGGVRTRRQMRGESVDVEIE